MSGILIAFIAQILVGISLVVDKILINPVRDKSRIETGTADASGHRISNGVKGKQEKNLLAYLFWLGILSAFAFIFIPFGFEIPSSGTLIALALFRGLLFFLALLFYYLALQAGEASHTLAIVGGFAPIATLLLSDVLLLSTLNVAEYIAFGLLAGGGLVMFFSERFSVTKILPWVLLSALFWGLANVTAKMVFDETDFVTGFVIMKTGTFLSALALLLWRPWRRRIFATSLQTPAERRTLYFGNRILAGVSSLLITYAIKLEHPALIEAIGGFKYVVIFLLALAITMAKPQWLRETFRGWALVGKVLATILIVAGLGGLGLQGYYGSQPTPAPGTLTWGVTFSPLASERLGLDWKENYRAILNDLHPDGLRLIAYWDRIEPEHDVFDFSELDLQMDEAARANIPVILAIGQKVPRWPECHVPRWAQTLKPAQSHLAHQDFPYKEDLFKYLETVVTRYRNHSALEMWQVENEPFLLFGECPHEAVKSSLQDEIALVRELDPEHPILTTDGGEFGDWYRAAKQGDVFGTTLYRRVYNDTFGHVTYPLTPEFYPLKTDVVRFFIRSTGSGQAEKSQQKFVVIELGLEPWDKKQLHEIPYGRHLELFSPDDFEETIAYARRTRFDTYYMWGAEWWYWTKTVQGDDRFWSAAQRLIE